MAKKITTEEADQDALLRSYSRIQAFYLENRNTIITAGVVVILAIALAIGYHYYKKSQNGKAAKKMAMAEEYMMHGNFKLALTGSEKYSTAGFQQIIDEYSSTKAGNIAQYYAAISEFQLGNTQKAVSYIDKFSPHEGILGVAPLSFKAMLYVQTGKYARGAQIYVKAAEWDKNKSTTPYNYLQAARAYQDAGKLDTAEEYAKKIVDNYPNSSQVESAKKLLGFLGDSSSK